MQMMEGGSGNRGEVRGDDAIARMPKAELHVHADGCLRIETIADLAQEQGVRLPVPREELREASVVTEPHPSLTEYLERYLLPLTVLQTPQAIERMIYELCEDARRENVRYIEPRFGPALHTERDASLDEVIAAACRGWAAGSRDHGLEGGLILCAIRQRSPEENLEVARAGERYLGQGVVGFDIAGIEAGFPLLAHRAAFSFARAAGYGITIHAGEAAGAESVRDAIEVIGAPRIGHGVRAYEDPRLLPILRERGVTLEMCPTSNVQTSAVPALEAHPIRRYFDDGIRVTVNTDGRTVSDTTVTKEMERVRDALHFTTDELWQMTEWALEAGFAPVEARRHARWEYSREMAEARARGSTATPHRL